MAILRYDFAVVGMNRVFRALASLEKRFVQHNSKMARLFGGTSARGGGGGGGASMRARLAADLQKSNARALAAEKRLAQERVAINRKAERQITAGIRAEARARIRLMQHQQREQAKAARAAQVRFRRGVGLVGGATRRGVSRVSGLAGGALAIGGGFALSDAIGAQKRSHAGAADLANQAFGTAAAGTRSRQSLKMQALSAAKSTAAQSGFGTEQVLGAMRTFHGKAGDINVATELAPFFADVADATGTELADVGETAGQIFMSALAQGMDPESAKKAVKDIIGVMGGQAKSGAIELKDQAKYAGKLMSAAGQFSGSLPDLANTMGAMGQLAIAGGAEGPAEAMTALMRFADDVSQKGGSRAFTKHGVSVFSDKSKTKLKDPAEILMSAVHKSKGSLPDFGKMFGIRAKKAAEPFRKVYVEAGGGEAGLAAMRKAFDRFRSLKMGGKEISESASFRRAQDDKKFDLAMVTFKEAVGSQLLPAVTQLVPAFVKMIPHIAMAAKSFADFVNWFAKNPIHGLGALVLASVAKDLAAAGIGAAIKAALETQVGKGFGALGLMLGGITLAADQLMKLIAEWSDPKEDQDQRTQDDIRIMKAHGASQTKVTRTKTFGDENLMPWDVVTGNTQKDVYLRKDEKTGEIGQHDTAKLYGGGIKQMASLADALKAATEGGAAKHKDAASALKEAAEALKKSAAGGPGGLGRGSDPTVPRR